MSRSCFTRCPRCGTNSYEQLQTHSHCVECLYSNDLAPSKQEERGYWQSICRLWHKADVIHQKIEAEKQKNFERFVSKFPHIKP